MKRRLQGRKRRGEHTHTQQRAARTRASSVVVSPREIAREFTERTARCAKDEKKPLRRNFQIRRSTWPSFVTVAKDAGWRTPWSGRRCPCCRRSRSSSRRTLTRRRSAREREDRGARGERSEAKKSGEDEAEELLSLPGTRRRRRRPRSPGRPQTRKHQQQLHQQQRLSPQQLQLRAFLLLLLRHGPPPPPRPPPPPPPETSGPPRCRGRRRSRAGTSRETTRPSLPPQAFPTRASPRTWRIAASRRRRTWGEQRARA